MVPPGGWATASDAALIAAVRSGDSGAFGVLYERHAPAAQGLAHYLLHGPADADDVVAETFARVLDLLKRGAGPAEAFRPYLLASVRRVAMEQVRKQQRQIPTDQADLPDPGEPFADPALARLEQSLVARAFRSLPERWSAVLWHTEVEQATAAEVALLFGLTPNGVAALSYRAREGLRQAYLQFHLSSHTAAQCRRIAGKLGAYVRGALSTRDSRLVEGHLLVCTDCQAARSELAAVNGSLRSMLAPAFLGASAAAAAGHLVAPASGAIASTASKAIAIKAIAASATRWFARLERWRQVAVAGAVAAAVVPAAVTVPHLLPYWHAGGAGGRQHDTTTAARAGYRSGHSGRAGQAGRVGLGAPAAKSGSPTTGTGGTGRGSGAQARLQVHVSVAGSLKPGAVVVVTVHIANPGSSASGTLSASLTLPPGVILLGPAGSAGWTCGSGGGCSHRPIGAGASTALSYQVQVVSQDGCGQQIIATVTNGSLTATGVSGGKVQCRKHPHPHRSPHPHPSHSPNPHASH